MRGVGKRPRIYDHRLRELVRTTGDTGIVLRLGVPRSTADGWLHAEESDVVRCDVLDMDNTALQAEVLRLRRRICVLPTVVRLLLVLVRLSGARLTDRRLPDGEARTRLLRTVGRARTVVASASTWARLIRVRGRRRPRLRIHPEKPKVGLRTTRPDEAWHVDTTLVLLLDGTKAYVHAAIDNFNERIDEVVASGSLRRVLAQTEIAFSNSMIEVFWRTMKHQRLFLNTLDTVAGGGAVSGSESSRVLRGMLGIGDPGRCGRVSVRRGDDGDDGRTDWIRSARSVRSAEGSNVNLQVSLASSRPAGRAF